MSPADVMLWLLLSAQQPGRSPHAKIFLDSCDERCRSKPRCEEPRLYCRPPRWSGRHDKYYRYETWAEGVVRYDALAQAIVTVAKDMTWREHQRCDAPSHGRSVNETCRRAHRARPWIGGERQLERLLATVIVHESALRRDVHQGHTRGDCDYREVGGRRVVIEGSCRSHCLGQVQVLRGQQTARGYSADDLVGLERAATTRCLQTAVDRLSGAHAACTAQNSGRAGAYPACTMGLYGGVGNWGSDPRIAARRKTYETLAARAKSFRALPERVLRALGR